MFGYHVDVTLMIRMLKTGSLYEDIEEPEEPMEEFWCQDEFQLKRNKVERFSFQSMNDFNEKKGFGKGKFTIYSDPIFPERVHFFYDLSENMDTDINRGGCYVLDLVTFLNECQDETIVPVEETLLSDNQLFCLVANVYDPCLPLESIIPQH